MVISFPQIYIINLVYSVDRRERMLKRIAELGLTAEIFPAIDGKTLTKEQMGYSGRLRRLFYGKDLSIGEIGCARSHLAICKKIADGDHPYALVLEDDTFLADNLVDALGAIVQFADAWDIVRFLDKSKDVKRSVKIRDLGKGFCLSRIYGTPGGAYAYVLNKRAATTLVRKGSCIWMPIDTLQGQVWMHGLRVRALVPSPVIADMEIESTIGDKRFEKKHQLQGLEAIFYPLTRTMFKIFDSLVKQITFRLGRIKDFISVS